MVCFQLNALGMDLTRRNIGGGGDVRGAGGDILLRQVVNCNAIEVAAARRLELQTGFDLLGGGRFQRFAVRARQHRRGDRLAVAQIRRKAIIQGVQQRGAAADMVV